MTCWQPCPQAWSERPIGWGPRSPSFHEDRLARPAEAAQVGCQIGDIGLFDMLGAPRLGDPLAEDRREVEAGAEPVPARAVIGSDPAAHYVVPVRRGG